jgi:hypothetical protein
MSSRAIGPDHPQNPNTVACRANNVGVGSARSNGRRLVLQLFCDLLLNQGRIVGKGRCDFVPREAGPVPAPFWQTGSLLQIGGIFVQRCEKFPPLLIDRFGVDGKLFLHAFQIGRIAAIQEGGLFKDVI